MKLECEIALCCHWWHSGVNCSITAKERDSVGALMVDVKIRSNNERRADGPLQVRGVTSYD